MNETEIKAAVAKQVYTLADDLDWMHLNIEQHKQYYKMWTTDAKIGEMLRNVMPPEDVRVYIKDTLMKTYMENHRPNLESLLTSMSISYNQITKKFEKPQALLCDSTHMYTLTKAREWKTTLMTTFERGCEVLKLEKNIVFVTEYTAGRFVDKEYRDLINSAARRLNVDIHWLV